MNLKFYLLGILIVLGVNLRSLAQVSYNKRAMGAIGTAPNPADFQNGASLENVDMTTGTLRVGIPLYEIKANDISVPISLSYSALGLKVGQEAGIVGMGWELSTGGKIMTNVQGLRDDEPGKGIGYFSQYPNVPPPGGFDPFANGTDRAFVGNVLDNKKDGAWDTYNYSLPNGGGTYIKNGLTFPYDPLITIDHNAKTIKTTDGLIYNFVEGDAKKITRRKFYDNSTPVPLYNTDVSKHWDDLNAATYSDRNLSSIVSSKFKDTVYFEYDNVFSEARLGAKTRISTSESLPFIRNVTAVSVTDGGVYEDANRRFYKVADPIISVSKTEVTHHARIKAINFPNGRVDFEYAVNDILGRDVLIAIVVYQQVKNVFTVLRKYEFEYDQTSVSFGHYLKAVNVYDSKNLKVDNWSFTYNDKMPVVPNQENKAQDRWGFYNGQSGNKTLLENPDSALALRVKYHYPIANSNYTFTSKAIYYNRTEAVARYGTTGGSTWINGYAYYSTSFADRRFDFAQAIRGTLASVKMPTGATVAYEYEPHRFRFVDRPTSTTYNGVVMNGGGIRIKSITRSSGHEAMYVNAPEGRTSKKRYEYGEGNYGGSGSSAESLGYATVTIPGNVLDNLSTYYSAGFVYTPIHNIMLLSHPVNNMDQYGGSYGIYPSVGEYLVDVDNEASGKTFGKTVYYNNLPLFANSPDLPWQENGNSVPQDIGLPLHYISPGVQKELIKGIAGMKKYRYIGTAYRAIEETKYEYDSYPAPLNAGTKQVSFYGTLTGQMSGPLPAYTAPVEDPPFEITDPTLGVVNTFNSVNSSGNGQMDFVSRTHYADESGTPNFPGKYALQFIDMATLSNCIRKKSEQHMVYDDNGNTVHLNTVNYYYDNPAHLLATRITSLNSKGDSVIQRTKYAQDYSSASDPGISYMKTNKLSLTEPVEQISLVKKTIGGIAKEYVTGAELNTFKVLNGSVFADKVYKTHQLDTFVYQVPYYYTGNSVDTNKYKPQVGYDLYINGNVHKYTEANGSGNVILWGYGNQYPVAKVNNANTVYGASISADVAYANFESGEKGNWAYAGTPVTDLTGPSGKNVYSLATGNITKTYSANNIRYVVTYWYKTGATVNITGGTLTAPVIKNTKGAWSLAEREVTVLNGTLTVSGTGFIDELRFHPYDSQMTTYTYDPLIGISGIIDPKGKLQFYEYDGFQRLKNIRDQQGNIIKSYWYIMGAQN